MHARHIELRRLVRILRDEFSRIHSEHWYGFDDGESDDLIPVHFASFGEARTAIRRADDGEYGICIDCDEPIALERLRAKPASIRCLACQRRLEAATAA